jgi:hypothetical protein
MSSSSRNPASRTEAILAILVAPWFTGAAAAEAGGAGPVIPKKVVVFCAGIEKHTSQKMQEKNYFSDVKAIAEDASEVYDQLLYRTHADRERSQRLLFDRKPAPKLPALSLDYQRDEITLEKLTKALIFFLRSVEEDELAIIYLGGHGAIPPKSNTVSFLPSDFDTDTDGNFNNDFKMKYLFEMIRDELLLKRERAHVIVFANMCRAGAADPKAEEGRRPLDLEGDQSPRILCVPAALKDKNAYERDERPFNGRSEFATHLLQGLEGSADKFGRITSHSLLEFLHDKGIPVPSDEPFDILLGRVNEDLARWRGVMADGLIAVAWDLGGDEWKWALTLADRQLQQRIHDSPDSKVPSLVRRIQCARLANTGSKVERLAEELSDVQIPEDGSVYSKAASQIKAALSRPGRAATRFHAILGGSWTFPERFPREWQDREKKGLQRAVHEVAMILEEKGRSEGVTELPAELILTKEPWDADEGSSDGKSVGELSVKIDQILSHSGDKGYLLLVWCGSSHGLRTTPPGTAAKDAPAHRYDDLYKALARWPGKVVVIWIGSGDLPFATVPEGLGKRLIVLSSSSPGDKSPSYLFTTRFIRELKEGYRPDWRRRLGDSYQKRWDDFLKRNPDAVFDKQQSPTAAKPWSNLPADAPLPEFLTTGPSQVDPFIRPIALPSSRWAYDLALEHDGSPVKDWSPVDGDEPEEARPSQAPSWEDERKGLLATLKGPNVPKEEVRWKQLRLGALSEALKDYDEATKFYGDFLRDLPSSPPDAGTETTDMRGISKEAFSYLKDLRDIVSRRLQATETIRDKHPRIYLILAPVVNYNSPLIPVLAGPRADVAAWQQTLERLFPPRGDEKTIIPLLAESGERDQINDMLGKALDLSMNEDDVIAFVFSGRAYQDDGGRYLVPADAQPTEAFARFTMSPPARLDMGKTPSNGTIERLIKVEDLVSRCLARTKKRSFVGIFDCQFTPVKPGDPPWPTVKHLLATYPPNLTAPLAPPPPSESTFPIDLPLPERRSAENVQFIPNEQVSVRPPLLIWCRGGLSEEPAPPSRLDDADGPPPVPTFNVASLGLPGPEAPTGPGTTLPRAASPFSRALLKALTPPHHKSSYADWIRRAGREFPPGGRFGFVVQGPAERPLLTRSVKEDTLRLLLRDYYRRGQNLDLLIEVLTRNETLLKEPLDNLTRGVLLAIRARLLNTIQPDGATTKEQDAWDDAEKYLTTLRKSDIDTFVKGSNDSALADAFIYYYVEAIKSNPKSLNHNLLINQVRQRLNNIPVLRTEKSFQILIDVTKSSARENSNTTVEASLATVRLFGPGFEGQAEDLRRQLRADTSSSDLLPVRFTDAPAGPGG